MALTNGIQFGRYVEVEVKNFTTGEKITIPNNLKIEFDFYKTIDEVDEASVGQVKIYGLTDETHRSLGEAGSEVTLKCGYVNDEIKVLFVASSTLITREYSDNSVVSVINVSANFNKFKFTKLILNQREASIASQLMYLADFLGYWFEFDLGNVPSEYQSLLEEYISTRKIVFTGTFTAKSALDIFCKKFCIVYHTRTEPDDSKGILSFRLEDRAIPVYVQQAQNGYEKIKTLDESSVVDFDKFKSIFITPSEEDDTAFVITKSTGMLGYPKEESKIINVPENWKPSSNEKITDDSQVTIQERKIKDAEASKKRAERQAKAQAAGKTLKPQKPKKLRNIKISRKYLRVTALLNPSVRPQSHVKVESEFTLYNGVYRVRNARYTGNNTDGGFNMELYLEDSGGKFDTVATDKEIEKSMQENVDGSLGNNTSYGNDSGDTGGEE